MLENPKLKTYFTCETVRYFGSYDYNYEQSQVGNKVKIILVINSSLLYHVKGCSSHSIIYSFFVYVRRCSKKLKRHTRIHENVFFDLFFEF